MSESSAIIFLFEPVEPDAPLGIQEFGILEFGMQDESWVLESVDIVATVRLQRAKNCFIRVASNLGYKLLYTRWNFFEQSGTLFTQLKKSYK